MTKMIKKEWDFSYIFKLFRELEQQNERALKIGQEQRKRVFESLTEDKE
jgi:hypothetical protein